MRQKVERVLKQDVKVDSSKPFEVGKLEKTVEKILEEPISAKESVSSPAQKTIERLQNKGNLNNVYKKIIRKQELAEVVMQRTSAQQVFHATQKELAKPSLVAFAQQQDLSKKQSYELVIQRLGQLYSYKAELNNLLGSSFNPIERGNWKRELEECNQKITLLESDKSVKIDRKTKKRFTEQQNRDLTAQLVLLHTRKADLGNLLILSDGPLDYSRCLYELKFCDAEIARLEADGERLRNRFFLVRSRRGKLTITLKLPGGDERPAQIKIRLSQLYERETRLNDILTVTISPLERKELLQKLEECKQQIKVLEADKKSGIDHKTKKKFTEKGLKNLERQLKGLYEARAELEQLTSLMVISPTEYQNYQLHLKFCVEEIGRLEAEWAGFCDTSPRQILIEEKIDLLGQLRKYKAELNSLLSATFVSHERRQWTRELKQCEQELAMLALNNNSDSAMEIQQDFTEQQRQDLLLLLKELHERKAELGELMIITAGPIDYARCEKELKFCSSEIVRLEADLALLGVKQSLGNKEARLTEIQQELPQLQGRKVVLTEVWQELNGELPALHQRKARINDLLSEAISPLEREKLLDELAKCKREIAILEAAQKSGINHKTRLKLTEQESSEIKVRLTELYQQKAELETLIDLSIFRPTNQAYYERQVELCNKEIARLEAEFVELTQRN